MNWLFVSAHLTKVTINLHALSFDGTLNLINIEIQVEDLIKVNVYEFGCLDEQDFKSWMNSAKLWMILIDISTIFIFSENRFQQFYEIHKMISWMKHQFVNKSDDEREKFTNFLDYIHFFVLSLSSFTMATINSIHISSKWNKIKCVLKTDCFMSSHRPICANCRYLTANINSQEARASIQREKISHLSFLFIKLASVLVY